MTAGNIYTVAGSGAGTAGAYGTAGFTGDGSAGTKAEVNSPMGVAVDGTGLVFADSQNNRIRTVAGLPVPSAQVLAEMAASLW
jgi:hypothetical protein